MPRRGRAVFARVLVALSLLCALAAVSAAGCGADQALVGGSCAAGYVQCGNRCVDLTSDPSNCGACGNACLPTAGCALSSCGLETADGSPDSGGDDGVAPLDGLEGFGDRQPPDAPAPDAPQTDGIAPDGYSDAGADTEASIGGDVIDSTTDSNPPADVENDSTQPIDSALDSIPPSDSIAPSDTSADSNPVDESGLDAAGAVDGSAEADTGAEADGSAEADAGPGCTAPLLACNGQCIDRTIDPSNCGDCNVRCVSGLCQNSVCVGTTTGAIIFVGHDFATVPVAAQSRVLSNAVFIPQTNPLNVLAYERYSDAAAITNVKTILTGAAQQVGRTLSITDTVTDSDIPTTLSIQNFSALVVLDQPGAPHGALATLGASWAATVATFTQAGGVVVVLDGDTGIAEMPSLVTGTGLLTVTAQAPVTTGAPLAVLSRGDAVGIGVVSPYAAGNKSASITTEPNSGSVVYVVATSADASAGAPVVVHKVF
jgi:hypothetical protein